MFKWIAGSHLHHNKGQRIFGRYSYACQYEHCVVVQNKYFVDTVELDNDTDIFYVNMEKRMTLRNISYVTFVPYRKIFALAYFCNSKRQLHLNNRLFDVDVREPIQWILHQDEFVFLLGKNTITILAPDMSIFGKREVIVDMHSPFIKGCVIVFVNGESVYTYDLMRDVTKCLYTHEKSIAYLTCVVNNGIVFASENRLYKLQISKDPSTALMLDGEATLIHDHMESIQWCLFENDEDYQSPRSKIKESFVETFMYDQMNANEKSLMTSLCKSARYIYNSPTCMKAIENISFCERFPFIRDVYKTVYQGTNIKDILHPPRCVFDKWTNYQDLTMDMGSVMHMPSSEKEIIHARSLMKTTGVFINPQYVLSGRMHCIWPNRGKGWHHNIESVPKITANVIYFAMTDASYYGGSFFFYRHPYTHDLQAVPDIHGTLKFFKLRSDKTSPLWHAIGSFTGHRLSYGLSKKADMGGTSDH